MKLTHIILSDKFPVAKAVMLTFMVSNSMLFAKAPVTQPPVDVEFVILITSYNNEKYARRNLDSVVNQRSSKPYQILVIDDGSTDATGKIMDKYVKKHNSLPRLYVSYITLSE